MGSPKSWSQTTGSNSITTPSSFFSQLGIKNHYSSLTHPQAKGQVEVTNRSLFKIIKTQLEGAKGVWPEETPFRLAYGSKAVIPAEVGLTSYRVGNHDERKNDKAVRL